MSLKMNYGYQIDDIKIVKKDDVIIGFEILKDNRYRDSRTFLKNASNTQELCYRPLQNVLLIPPSAGLRFFIGPCLALERDLIFLRYILFTFRIN